MIVLAKKNTFLQNTFVWLRLYMVQGPEQQRASSPYWYEKSRERELLFLSELCCYSSYDGDEFR